MIRLIYHIAVAAIANSSMKIMASAISIIMKNIRVNGEIAENVGVSSGKKSLQELLRIG